MRRFLAVGALLLAACGGGDDDNTGVTDGPRIRFEIPDGALPQPGQVPFPTDLYKDPYGTLVETLTDWTRLGIDMAQPSALFGQYGAANGFGVQSGVIFNIAGLAGPEQIDTASLTPDRFILVDVSPGVTAVPLAVTAGWDNVAKSIVVVPTDPLTPAHTYAMGVLNGPKIVDGDTLGADKQFGTLRDGGTIAGAGTTYSDAVTKLAAAGTDRAALIAATEFSITTDHEKALDTAHLLFTNHYGQPPGFTATPTAPFLATKFGRTTHAG
ncbi:hypothetical protein BH11MYX2_BH11MYX2_36400 [soil metagenome]